MVWGSRPSAGVGLGRVPVLLGLLRNFRIYCGLDLWFTVGFMSSGCADSPGTFGLLFESVPPA